MHRGTTRPTPPARVRPLHLPTPGLPARSARSERRRPKRRRQASRLRQLAMAVGCGAGSGLILMGLMALAERFNTLLLVSQAVANLIRGLTLLATGLLQLLALLMVAALALLALLLLWGGLTRLLRLLAGGAQRPPGPKAGARGESRA